HRWLQGHEYARTHQNASPQRSAGSGSGPQGIMLCGLDGLRRERRLENSRENVVNVPELIVEIERALDVGARKHARNVRVGKEQRLELGLLGKGAHRVALNPFVRLLARYALLREL